MGAAGIIICTGIILLTIGLACGSVAADEGRVFNVVDYGARGDGSTDDTKAFVAAWTAACGAKAASATVDVPAQKTFLVGPVRFQGPCASKNITVKVTGKIMAPPLSAWNGGANDHWLRFSRVNGLTVTGEGTLDGNGESWWVKRCKNQGCLKAAPMALHLLNCKNVWLSHFHSENSPMMHIVFTGTRSVRVHNLTIVAPGHSPNTDGIHVSHSQDVQITNSTISTGDDCVSIVSGSSFITVDGVICGPGHGVSIGSLGKGGKTALVENVDVRNVHFINSTSGPKIKTWEGARGYAKSISFTNIQFTDVDIPVVITQFYGQLQIENALVISNVTYTNLWGTSKQSTAVMFKCGTSGSCTDIHVRSMNITGPDGGKAIAQCQNIQGDTSGYINPEIPCLKK